METKLITLASVKGGVGKSTHAIALSAGLLDLGHTVRAIETDEQGTFGAWADEVAEIDIKFDSVYLSAEGQNFDTANQSLFDYSQDVEFVIVDTAGAANALTLACLYTADLVVSPFMLSEPDIEGLKRTYDQYTRLFKKIGEDVPDSFLALFLKEASFLSNVDKGRLRKLIEDFFLRYGLPKNPSIRRWAEAGRTPLHLKDGMEPIEGAQPLTDVTLKKAETFVNEFTKTVLEVVNAQA